MYLNVTDVVGKCTVENRSFIVDVPVFLDVSCPYNNTYTNETEILVSWNISGPADNLTIMLNETPIMFDEDPPEYGNCIVEISEDGFWIIEVNVRGYWDNITRTVYVWVDTAPPEVWVEPGNVITIETTEPPRKRDIARVCEG